MSITPNPVPVVFLRSWRILTNSVRLSQRSAWWSLSETVHMGCIDLPSDRSYSPVRADNVPAILLIQYFHSLLHILPSRLYVISYQPDDSHKVPLASLCISSSRVSFQKLCTKRIPYFPIACLLFDYVVTGFRRHRFLLLLSVLPRLFLTVSASLLALTFAN